MKCREVVQDSGRDAFRLQIRLLAALINAALTFQAYYLNMKMAS